MKLPKYLVTIVLVSLLCLPVLSSCAPLQELLATSQSAGGARVLSSVWDSETLRSIYDTRITPADPIEIQSRLYGVKSEVFQIPSSVPERNIGESRTFWVANGSEDQTTQTVSFLRAVSPHLYVWIQEGISYDQSQLASLTTSFEENIYPQMRSFFGEQWDPGVDGDSHIYLLYAAGVGQGMGGYFSTVDEYPSTIFTSSNECEMITVNADEIPLSGKGIERVVAHEFQHMIHFSEDANEDVWVNEGLSEYAVFTSGIKDLRLAQLYFDAPDQQLTYWKDATAGMDNAPLYGQAFLFTSYFAERFGPDSLTALVHEPANGIVGYQKIIQSFAQKGSEDSTFNDVYYDWAVANAMQDASIEKGKYDYAMAHGLTLAYAGKYTDCSSLQVSDTVNQFGADYYKFSCPGSYTLTFKGDELARLFTPDAHSSSYDYWSNIADRSDMTLSKTFDLTNAVSPIFSYFTNYELEANRDYVYVEVSADNGNTWKFVEVPEALPAGQPNLQQFGLTGKSDGWVEKQIDLSAYAGQSIIIRFEYITDTSLTGEGFFLDDVSLPETGYSCDFEQDSCGWESDGFIRTQATAPQTFRLAIMGGSGQNKVVEVPLTGNNEVTVDFKVSKIKPVVFLVTAETPFVNMPANYSFSVSNRNK